jgi:hypothetical protein
MACKPSSLELIFLSCWGAVYFGLVVALTRRTSLAVVEIIEALLIPSLSEDCADSARENIEKNFVRPRIFMKSLGAASIAMLISCMLLPRSHGIELVIWGLGFFILYFTASQATLTAPFYTCFSQSLKAHDDVLFPIDPAASPSIIACAALAKRVLFYWFLVFVLVMSLTALPWFAGKSFAGVGPFISAVVFVAGFFSFGFGSLVYLRFENDLRIAMDRVRLTTLSTVQVRCVELFSSRWPLSAEACAQLDRLERASGYLSRPGYFRSSFQTLSTVLIAIVPPIVSIVVAVLNSRRP